MKIREKPTTEGRWLILGLAGARSGDRPQRFSPRVIACLDFPHPQGGELFKGRFSRANAREKRPKLVFGGLREFSGLTPSVRATLVVALNGQAQGQPLHFATPSELRRNRFFPSCRELLGWWGHVSMQSPWTLSPSGFFLLLRLSPCYNLWHE